MGDGSGPRITAVRLTLRGMFSHTAGVLPRVSITHSHPRILLLQNKLFLLKEPSWQQLITKRYFSTGSCTSRSSAAATRRCVVGSLLPPSRTRQQRMATSSHCLQLRMEMMLVSEEEKEPHTNPLCSGQFHKSRRQSHFKRTDGWSFHPFLRMTLLLLFINSTKGALTWEQRALDCLVNSLPESSHLAQAEPCRSCSRAPSRTDGMPHRVSLCHTTPHCCITSHHNLAPSGESRAGCHRLAPEHCELTAARDRALCLMAAGTASGHSIQGRPKRGLGTRRCSDALDKPHRTQNLPAILQDRLLRISAKKSNIPARVRAFTEAPSGTSSEAKTTVQSFASKS